MLKIISITEEQCLGWILLRPELAEISFSMKSPRFEETKSSYYAVCSSLDIIGVVKSEQLCEFGVQIHPYLNPKYWHSDMLFKTFSLLCEHFKTLGYKSIITWCPEDAKHAIKASQKVGMKKIGRIKKAVNWKGKMNSLIMLQRVI